MSSAKVSPRRRSVLTDPEVQELISCIGVHLNTHHTGRLQDFQAMMMSAGIMVDDLLKSTFDGKERAAISEAVQRHLAEHKQPKSDIEAVAQLKACIATALTILVLWREDEAREEEEKWLTR
jgi:hypothetical protein